MRRRLAGPIGVAGLVSLTGALWGCAGGGASEPPAPAGSGAGDAPVTWLRDATADWGLDFRHDSGAAGQLHLPEIMGSGVALFDADGDGDLDLYLVQAGGGPPGGNRAAAPGNRLFLQQPGPRLVDATSGSGLDDRGYGTGVAAGDIDNDGDVDLYVANDGADRLYLNSGDGTFRDATGEAGIDVDGWSTSVALCDLDADGWLDIYVARYVIYDPTRACFDPGGTRDYCSPEVFPPRHDVLLRNLGGGRFEDVSQASGIAAAPAPGLGVVCEELTGDGRIDVYVANDGAANQLWKNEGNWVFRDEAPVRGAAYNLSGEAEAGMGVLAADLDGDTIPDLFMTHLREESNTLYRNLGGHAGFADVSGQSGLAGSSLPYTGFGTAALDLESDGDLDLVVVNGRVMRAAKLDGSRLAPPWDVYAEPNLLYLNDGAGRFVSACDRAPDFCSPHEISRGLAVGDLDRDGDLDLVTSNTQGPARLFLNEAPREGHWLAVLAVDPRWQREAIGARVVVEAGDRRLARSVGGSFGYLSSSPPTAWFGLPAAEVERFVVRWPDGVEEAFTGTGTDRRVTLLRGQGEPP